jgi:hypothetical protein
MGTGSAISMLEGNTFVVSDPVGDIAASPTDTLGLFAWDTRHLSRWVLTINGQTLNPLSTDAIEYYATRFFLVPGMGTVYVDADLSIMRKRSIGRQGFREDLTALNHSERAIDLDMRIEAAADFADLFEVKDALPKKGEAYIHVETDRLVLGFRRELFVRETHISARVVAAGADGYTDGAPVVSHVADTGTPGAPDSAAQLDERGLHFSAHIAPHGRWNAQIEVLVAQDPFGQPARGRLPGVQLDMLAQIGAAGLQTEQPSPARGAPANTFKMVG